MINLVNDHLQMIRFDLATLFQALIVFCKLSEDVVCTMICVDLVHEARVAGPQVNQLLLHIVDVQSDLMRYCLNALRINVAHILQHFSRRKTAGHKVLEDVVNERDVFIDHSVYETAETTDSLESEAALEEAAHLRQIMQKVPILEF